jgi:hypothetical protein
MKELLFCSINGLILQTHAPLLCWPCPDPCCVAGMNQLVGGQVLVKEMVSWERLCHQAERKVPMPLQLDRAPIAVFLEQQLVLTKSNSMKCIKQKLNGPEALSFTTSTPMGTSYLFYMQWPFAVKLDQELARQAGIPRSASARFARKNETRLAGNFHQPVSDPSPSNGALGSIPGLATRPIREIDRTSVRVVH